MKKISSLLIVIVGLLFLTGCNKTTKCTLEIDQGNYKVNSEYAVTYDKNKNVVKVNTKEVVTSSDEAVLDQFEETIKEQYAPYSNIKHYNFSINRKKGELTEKISVNYKKLDVDKFISIDESAASMFDNGNIKYDRIISIYKMLGAKCEE